MHELSVEQLCRLLGAFLPLTRQRLVEALALAEALELVDALVSLADSLLTGQVYRSRVHGCQLEIDHVLAEVTQEVQS